MTTMKSQKRDVEEFRRKRPRRRKKIVPMTRMAPGDMVRIADVSWCSKDEGGVRMWDVDTHEFTYVPVHNHALLLSIIRPVTEFSAVSHDSHWIMILHNARCLEALSDELEEFVP